MALDWLPVYRDTVDRDRGLGAAFQPYYGGAAFPALTQWRPRYPDRFPARMLPTAAILASSGNIRPIPTLPSTPLAWQGRYPDQTFRARRGLPIPWPTTLVVVLTPVVPAPGIAWEPQYPDLIARAKRPIPTQVDLFVGGLTLAPYDSWLPVYPNRLPRLRLPASDQQTVALITPSPLAVTDLRWKASYPDQTWPRVSLRPGAQRTTAINLDPIVNPAPSLAGLTPVYPHRIAPRVSLRAGTHLTFTTTISPIPQAAAPDFSWQALGPAWIATSRLPTAARLFWAGPFGAAAQIAFPLAWVGQQPARLALPRLPILSASGVVQAPSGIVPLPLQGGWRPVYPDPLRRPQTAPAGVLRWVVDPVVIIGGVTCITIGGDTLTQPTLADEGLTVATFTDESLTVATLGDEEIC